MTDRPYPRLPTDSVNLPWAGLLDRRCRARLTPEESPTYYGRCELKPHDASMGHALERGMEIHRWVTEVSVESPDRVTWRGIPEPVHFAGPLTRDLRSDHRPLVSDFDFNADRRGSTSRSEGYETSWSRPMLTLPPEKVPDTWWSRRRFVRTYMSLRRIVDLHNAAGHHTEFTAVNEGHIAFRCHTCSPMPPLTVSTERRPERG